MNVEEQLSRLPPHELEALLESASRQLNIPVEILASDLKGEDNIAKILGLALLIEHNYNEIKKV